MFKVRHDGSLGSETATKLVGASSSQSGFSAPTAIFPGEKRGEEEGTIRAGLAISDHLSESKKEKIAVFT
jgi:hypothetical protein